MARYLDSYTMAGPGGPITSLTVQPIVQNSYRIIIDDVSYDVEELSERMRDIEENQGVMRGLWSLIGSDHDRSIGEMLIRHAGLKSLGGYSSCPAISDKTKWRAFRDLLNEIEQGVFDGKNEG